MATKQTNKETEVKEPEVKATDEEVTIDVKSLNLLQRILLVRASVTRLGKDAQVSGYGEGYKAITHDKVTARMRPLMNDARIVSWITCVDCEDAPTGANTKAGRAIVQHRATFCVTFANADNPDDKLEIMQRAYADDFGDKAPGKATSYAMKYALLKLFMVETGEDDEERKEVEGRAPVLKDNESLMLDVFAVAEECFGDDAPDMLKAMAERRFMVKNYGEIPQDRVEDAIRSLRKKREQMEGE